MKRIYIDNKSWLTGLTTLAMTKILDKVDETGIKYRHFYNLTQGTLQLVVDDNCDTDKVIAKIKELNEIKLSFTVAEPPRHVTA